MSKKASAFDAILEQHTRMTAATQAAIDAPETPEQSKPSESRHTDMGRSGQGVYRTFCPDCGKGSCGGECQMPTDVPRCGYCWAPLPHEPESECHFSEHREPEDPHAHEQRAGKKGRAA